VSPRQVLAPALNLVPALNCEHLDHDEPGSFSLCDFAACVFSNLPGEPLVASNSLNLCRQIFLLRSLDPNFRCDQATPVQDLPNRWVWSQAGQLDECYCKPFGLTFPSPGGFFKGISEYPDFQEFPGGEILRYIRRWFAFGSHETHT